MSGVESIPVSFLDEWVTNYHGDLLIAAKGNFSKSCKYIHLNTETMVLTANCPDGKGNTHARTLYLGAYVDITAAKHWQWEWESEWTPQWQRQRQRTGDVTVAKQWQWEWEWEWTPQWQRQRQRTRDVTAAKQWQWEWEWTPEWQRQRQRTGDITAAKQWQWEWEWEWTPERQQQRQRTVSPSSASAAAHTIRDGVRPDKTSVTEGSVFRWKMEEVDKKDIENRDRYGWGARP